ncbi:MAG: AEC family transporter [Planctomycetota bacterium]|jgi:predicted permease
MHIVNALTPIVLLISLGAVLRWAGFLKPTFFRDINPLIYWVALPCLLFYKTAGAEVRFGESMKITLLLFAGTTASLLLGYGAGFALRLPRSSLGAFVQGAYRGNYVYVGLPVILYGLAGVACPFVGGYEALVFLAIAPLVPLNNISAVLVLLARGSGNRRGKSGPGRLALDVLTNPIILSIGAGMAWSLTGWPLPRAVATGLDLMGQVALPLALFSTGASLSLGALRGNLLPALAATLIKVAFAPVLGWVIAVLAGYTGAGMKVAILLLACPTAVISFVMAEQLGADHRLAGSIVVLSTALSMISLALVLVCL